MVIVGGCAKGGRVLGDIMLLTIGTWKMTKVRESVHAITIVPALLNVYIHILVAAFTFA